MSAYCLLKDFAGPTATILAASAATFVTWRIQKQNHKIAANRLKLDMFEKRYEVYVAARDLLKLLLDNPDIDDPVIKSNLDRTYAKLAEADFVCGERSKAFCKEVFEASQSWRSARAQAGNANLMQPGPERIAAVLAPSTASGTILILLNRAVDAFSDDLRIWLPS